MLQVQTFKFFAKNIKIESNILLLEACCRHGIMHIVYDGQIFAIFYHKTSFFCIIFVFDEYEAKFFQRQK